MKSYLTFTLAFIASIFIFVTVVSILGIRRIPDVAQYRGDRLVPIYSNSPATQSFISNENGLNTILINLKNRSIINNKIFEFNLLEDDIVVRKIIINGSNIGDGDNVRFQFLPISDSKGKKYVIKLTAPDTNQGDIPIEVSFSNNDSYLSGSSLDQNQEGDFAFQTYYKPQSLNVTLSQLVIRWINIFINFRLVISLVVVSALFVVTAKKLGFRYN